MWNVLGCLIGLYKLFNFEDEFKTISNDWLDKTGKKEKLKGKGYKRFYFCNLNKQEEWKLKGYEVVFDYDFLKRKRIAYKYGDSILMAKK